MGVLEDIEGRWAERCNLLEAQLAIIGAQARATYQATSQLQADLTNIETEHQALGRRMHAIESENNQAQHGEISALGRRVEKLEGLPTVLESSLQAAEQSLREQLTSLIEAQPAPILAAVTALLEAQQKVMLRHLSPLEDWLRREQAWASQPWWKRWWRRTRGERP